MTGILVSNVAPRGVVVDAAGARVVLRRLSLSCVNGSEGIRITNADEVIIHELYITYVAFGLLFLGRTIFLF